MKISNHHQTAHFGQKQTSSLSKKYFYLVLIFSLFENCLYNPT